MNNQSRKAVDILPLTPAVLHILLALADGERHGYGIMQEVTRRAGGQVKMGPGTLYGSIKRMLADGLIEEAGKRPDSALDDEIRHGLFVSPLLPLLALLSCAFSPRLRAGDGAHLSRQLPRGYAAARQKRRAASVGRRSL